MPKVNTSADVGAKTENLSDPEMDLLKQSFDRSLEDTRSEDTEVIREKMQEYFNEIHLAAKVARYELSGSFDGQAPESGNFGITTIHPGYLGYNDWDSLGAVSGQSAFDWIDDDTPDNLNSGSSGFANPITVGEPVVHAILGFASYAPDPVTTRIKEEKNDNPVPAINTEDAFRNTDLRIAWRDTVQILQPDDTYAARGYAGGETGSTYNEAIYPIGVSFIEAKKARILDPADMAGTSDSDVVVET